MASNCIKRKDSCLSDKVKVIHVLESKKLQKTLAAESNVSQSQVSRTWKAKEKLLLDHRSNINPTRKRFRESTRKDIEEVLLRWFTQAKKWV